MTKNDRYPDNQFAIRNLQLTVAKCHFSCLKCKGPNEDDCTLCPNGDLNSDGTCECKSGYSFGNECGEICPDHLLADDKTRKCIPGGCVLNCSKCDTDKN